jgi:hypothetical protein
MRIYYLLFILLLLASCGTEETTEEQSTEELGDEFTPEQGSIKEEFKPEEGTVKEEFKPEGTGESKAEDRGGSAEYQDGECQTPGSNTDLYFYTSDDGASFSNGEKIYELVSVPNILVEEDNLIVSFQIFQDPPFCGGMAYIPVSFDGEVLDDVQALSMDGDYFTGFDPTLLTVNEQMVLTYTVRPSGMKNPCISVAVGDDISSLKGTDILWCSDDDDEQFMDSSALFLDPYLYIYVPSDNSMSSSSPVSYYAQVDVNDWEIVKTGKITDLDMFLLGEIIATDDDSCPYRFYGTYQRKVRSACTEDGLSFEVDEEFIVDGADPGVAQLDDGSYVMVITQK